ncbi:MAG: MFS transporter [Mycobacteriales bacterium]
MPERTREFRAHLSRAGERQAPDWLILALACLAQFMVVLDVSIVNVALPSIRTDLHFSVSGLQWVVNAYTLAFAGFLLLGGRAADLYGRRRIFLLGLALFTAASLAGGLAQDRTTLLLARTAQGLGGAVLSPATLTILTTTFAEGPRRVRAMGLWSAVAGAGGAAGALLGGLLTDLLGWRWILFVNVPIGIIAIVTARLVLRETRGEGVPRHLDVPGGVLVTAGLMSLVYGIVNTESHPWISTFTAVPVLAGVLLLAAFLGHEARFAKAPLVPLRLFRSRSVSGANLVMFCVGGSVFASWFFLSLYMQNVLGYSPLIAGLAFLPQTAAIIVGAQVSSRLVGRIGARPLLFGGPLISAVGLGLLSRISGHGSYAGTLLVPSVLVTLGTGLAFTPIALSATSGVRRAEAGLASGLVNTTRQVGGSLGLAVLATLAADRTRVLLAASHSASAALTAGYARAFGIAALLALVAAAASLVLPRHRAPAPAPYPDAPRPALAELAAAVASD